VNPAWAVFVSGRGSNAQALMDIYDEVPVRLVVASKPQIWGLRRAQRMGIATLVLQPKIDWQGLLKDLERYKITHIFLLGFMRLIPPEFLSAWWGEIYNLHPSLLPEYPGTHAIERSHEAGLQMGVTVHEVTPEMDAGRRCLQKISLQKASDFDLSTAQTLISRDEQRLVREWASRVSLVSRSSFRGHQERTQ